VSSQSSGIGKTHAGEIIEKLLEKAMTDGRLMRAPVTKIETSEIVREKYDALHGTNTLGNVEEKNLLRDSLGELARQMTIDTPTWQTDSTFATQGHTITKGIRDPEGTQQMEDGGAFLVRIFASHVVIKNQLGEAAYEKYRTDPREHQLDSWKKWDYLVQNHWHTNQSAERKRITSQSFEFRLEFIVRHMLEDF
jgi:hypothetical protein